MTTPDLLRKVAEAVFAACRGDAGAPGFPKRVDLDAIVARVQAEHVEVLDAPDSDGPWLARLTERAWDGKDDRWQPVRVVGFAAYVPGDQHGWVLSDFDRWQRIVPPKEG